jgi:hypothetical protein
LIEDAEICCFENSEGNEIKTNNETEEGVVLSEKLNESERHYDRCEFAAVKCPHGGCNDFFLRMFVHEHIDNCFHRLIPCEWCDKGIEMHLLEAHMMACPKGPASCPNNCLHMNGAVLYFTPSEISHHLSFCTMALAYSIIAFAGCFCLLFIFLASMILYR